MRRIGWLAVVLVAALPGWAAKKMTIEQLKDLLVSAKQSSKSDADVAKDLEGVELTEELTHGALESFGAYVPGQMTTEQLFILEAQSSVLAPPAVDIPTTAAPDAAAQKAILDKAMDYAGKTYAQLPAVTATKETRRFQDNAQMGQQAFGAHNNANLGPTITPIRYTSADSGPVTFHNGAEQAPAQGKGQWGANGMIAMLGQPPALSTVLDEAQQAGKISWTRWESVNGHQMAVFSYAVDKKKTRYEVSYCCFPETAQAGDIAMRGQETAGGAGNYQTQENEKIWKSKVGYHGEIFVDPTTGVVVRLITIADLKGSDPVRVETQRIDFGEQTVGGKPIVVPVRAIIDTMEQPYPDDPKGRMIFRHTLFTTDYKNYQAGS
ncbi:MAG TPA: hypothetical protein VG267_14555 [Terracidiphilus sp.]|jgi:hypothetical protein|nr:hypothetical protein [Terracidiphilus sp.]